MNKSRHIAVVLAGGSGRRMGGNMPKQYMQLAGRTVLEYSIEAFDAHPLIDEVAVVVHPDYRAEVEAMVQCCGWRKVRRILDGGAERSDSSLAAIRAYASDGDAASVRLLFHDAARPLVTARMIDNVCRALNKYEAVGTGLASVDTMMEVDGSVLTAVPDRRRMQRMQTPQGFRLETIVKAYRQAMADPHFRATDDCGVVMRYLPQTPIFIVPGDERAMKLTVPSDLPVLEQYLRSSDRQADVPAEEKPICAATRNKRRYVEQYHRTHLRELQLALLDILVAIDDVCRRHAIPYWLDSGTLLGAVRHGGFIPWDDDIDICMPREALPRFIEAALRELPPHLFVQTPDTEPEVRLPFYKVRNLNSFIVEAGDDFSLDYAKGLFVDIFPMEPWPTLPYRLSKRLARGYCVAGAVLHTRHRYSLRAAVEGPYFLIKRALFGAIWRTAGLVMGKKKYYANIPAHSGNGNRHLRSTIFPLGTITFEGRTFSAPADVDTYLRDLFGEYMTLPPVEQRTCHATFFMTRLCPADHIPSNDHPSTH